VVTFTGAVIGMLAMGMELEIPEGMTSDALVPLIYAEYFPLMGAVLVVAVFAAGMSTLDSQIISASSNFTQDLYGVVSDADDRGRMKASRVFEVSFVLVVVAFSFSESGRSLIAPLASIGVGMALAFLLPLLGALFWPRASEAAAFWSMLGSWGVMLAIQFGLLDAPGSTGPALWGLFASAVLFYGISLVGDDPVPFDIRRRYQDDMAERFPETRASRPEERALKAASARR